MQIIRLTSPMLSSNCYIVISNNEAIVIDPGIEHEKILNVVNEKSAYISKIIFTHAHIDHIFYAETLKKFTNSIHMVTREIMIYIEMNTKMEQFCLECTKNSKFMILN